MEVASSPREAKNQSQAKRPSELLLNSSSSFPSSVLSKQFVLTRLEGRKERGGEKK